MFYKFRNLENNAIWLKINVIIIVEAFKWVALI